jgi:hypothetical protein
MAFGKRAKKVREEAYDLIEQARETGEEALATVGGRLGERLGVYRPEPQSTSGEDALAFINGLVIGAVLCAIAAYFLAPTDGQKLRQRLKTQIDALLGRSSIEDTERAAAEAMDPHAETPVAGAVPVPAGV